MALAKELSAVLPVGAEGAIVVGCDLSSLHGAAAAVAEFQVCSNYG